MRAYEDSSDNNNQATTPKPPQLKDELFKIVKSQKDKRIIGDEDTPEDFGKKWMSGLEPPTKFDTPKPVYKDDQIIGWETPYIDRNVYLLKRFLSFDYRDQKFIIRNMEAGRAWRGEEMWVYRNLCEIYKQMPETPEIIADSHWPDILRSLVHCLSTSSGD